MHCPANPWPGHWNWHDEQMSSLSAGAVHQDDKADQGLQHQQAQEPPAGRHSTGAQQPHMLTHTAEARPGQQPSTAMLMPSAVPTRTVKATVMPQPLPTPRVMAQPPLRAISTATFTATSQLKATAQPAQPKPQMQTHAVPVQCGTHLTAAPPSYSSVSLQQLSEFGVEAGELHFLFDNIFTPKHPSEFPRSQWLSYARLFSVVQLYSPARVWKQGPGNLKQRVIEWCRHHPAFAGLEQSEWCMRLNDRPSGHISMVYKFCLELAM